MTDPSTPYAAKHGRPVRVVRDFLVRHDPRLESPYLSKGAGAPNVRFTFEGDRLVAVELIGDE